MSFIVASFTSGIMEWGLSSESGLCEVGSCHNGTLGIGYSCHAVWVVWLHNPCNQTTVWVTLSKYCSCESD